MADRLAEIKARAQRVNDTRAACEAALDDISARHALERLMAYEQAKQNWRNDLETDNRVLLDEVERLTSGIKEIGAECARRHYEIERLQGVCGGLLFDLEKANAEINRLTEAQKGVSNV